MLRYFTDHNSQVYRDFTEANMISLLVWLLILSSGSFLAAVAWNRKYEEILPITCSFLITVLFLFGITKHLMAGFYAVLLLTAGVFISAFIILFRQKKYRQTINCFFTPATFIFLLLTGFIFYCNHGRLAGIWDEFTHWMDIVKVMSTLDAFGTYPGTESMFQSYPPGMSLFQYSLQKVNTLCSGTIFSEWHAYAAYQVFIVAFCLPFFKETDYKKIGHALLSVIIVLLCPLFFFGNLYASVYIDPILGILMAVGFAKVFLQKTKDTCYHLTILSTCAMLVLMKDAGLLLAIFLAVFYLYDYCVCSDFKNIPLRKKWQSIVIKIVSVFGSIFLFKGLWNFHLKWTDAKIQFSAPFEFTTILNVIKGDDTTYRSEVWNNFWYAFSNDKITLENFQIGISYRSLTLLLMGVLILLVYLYSKQNVSKPKGFGLVVIEGSFLFIYVVGMCITYIAKFSEYEAVRLASFDRYMNIGYLSLTLLIVILAIDLIRQHTRPQIFLLILLLCGTLAVIPMDKVSSLIHRDAISKNTETRAQYTTLADKIAKYCSKDDRVYFIAQETAGAEYWTMRYSIRPVKMNLSFNWSIGEPFYDGDVYSVELSADEWKEMLVKNYDYVGLYLLNDYFYDNYSVLFEDPAKIACNELYKVDKETGLLIKCD